MKKRKRKRKKLPNIQNMMGFERIRVGMWVLDISKKRTNFLNVCVQKKLHVVEKEFIVFT
mgnify:CR=1 FL=1